MARRPRDPLAPTPGSPVGTTSRVGPSSRVSPARATAGAAGLVLLTGVASAGTAVLSGRLLSSLPSSFDAAALVPVDRWVELLVTAVGATAAAWLAFSGCLALVCVVAARLGRTWRAGESALRRAAPGAVHKLARVAVGVGVGTGLALVPTTAHAADSHEPAAPDAAAVVTSFDLGWQPTTSGQDDAPADSAPERAAAEVPAPPRVGGDDHVVVHRGDTLWAIASATLGDAASDADVARTVARWHDANRDVIGDDPDVILPGQVLHAPA